MAQVPTLRDTAVPYDVFVVEGDPEERQTFLGTLESYPDMYEVMSDRDFTLSLQLSQFNQTATLTQFSLIVVSENERGRGVTEVVRQNPRLRDGWTERYDSQLALSLHNAEAVAVPLKPGVYRFEISTPDNTGSYLLEFGTVPAQGGYFTTLERVRMVRDFFGVSGWGILRSTVILYPIGFVLLFVLAGLTWRYRDRLRYGLR